MSDCVEISQSDVVRFLESRVRHYDTTLRSRPVSVSDTLAIQDEIDDIGRPLALLRQRRNVLLSPISRLAPEITSLIFHELASIEPHYCTSPEENYQSYMQEKSTSKSPLGWIKATHVSSAWRACAIIDATLWTTVTFVHGRDWAEEMLLRSRDTAIVLQADMSSPAMAQAALEMIKRELPRIAYLDLILDGYFSPAQSAIDAFSSRAPLLQGLRVTGPGREYDMEQWHGLTTTNVATSGLTSLHVYDCYQFDWRKLSLPNLVSISIGRTTASRFADGLGYSIGAIHNVLSQATRLKTLSICDSIISIQSEDMDPDIDPPPLVLSHLTSIELNVPALGGIALLGRLRAPRCQSIKLEATITQHADAEQTLILSRLGNALMSAQLLHLKTLEFRASGARESDDRSFSVFGWNVITTSALMQDFEQDDVTIPTTDFSVIFHLPRWSSSHPISASMFLDSLCVEHVVNLAFTLSKEPACPRNFIQWDTLLSRCTSLRWLRADRGVALDLLLQHRSAMQRGDGCLIPRTLEVLALLCIQWDEIVCGSSRADDLAGDLWDACREDGYRLPGIMLGEDAYDGLYRCFTPQRWTDVVFLDAPVRPAPLDEEGDRDVDWADDMYDWDPVWNT